jgi:hypothetical protein
MLLSDLHKVIQTTMGWTNSHLHQFIHNNLFYTFRTPDDWMWDDNRQVDYKKKKVTISKLLAEEKDWMRYEYDFGDSWQHKVVLEKILPIDPQQYYPVCVSGKRSCPPEDCGGVWGYADLCAKMKEPGSPGYDDLMDWLGDEFDPECFNIGEINEALASKNFGCIDMDFG